MFDILSLIPTVAGFVCSTGVGTVVGKIIENYTKDSKPYEKLAAGVSGYLFSGYIADKCVEHLDGQVKQVKMTYDQIQKMRMKQRMADTAQLALEMGTQPQQNDIPDEEED